MNKGLFILFYLVLFASTYVVRYAVAMHGGTVGYSYSVGETYSMSHYSLQNSEDFLGLAEKILLGIYAVMTIITYLFGKRVGKPYLFIFPFIAGIFDTFMILMVFVPTVLNLVGFFMAAGSRPKNTQA